MSENRNDESADRDRVAFQNLLHAVELDAGASGFPALAEAYRRTGQPGRARTLAENGLAVAPERLAGRVALALSLIDLDEIEEASQELALILENVPDIPPEFGGARVEPTLAPLGPPIDRWPSEEALDTDPSPPRSPTWAAPLAEPGPVQTPDVSDRVEERIEEAEIDRAFASAEAEDPEEALDPPALMEVTLGPEGSEADDAGFAPAQHPEFATHAMAELLESQGDAGGAEAIRASMTPSHDGGAGEPAESEAAVVGTLEQWLENIRRNVA